MNNSHLLAELQTYYPQMLLLKYIELFDNQGFEKTETHFEYVATLFLLQKGKEKMQALILEIECVEANDDLAAYANLLLMLRGEGWAEETLQEMGEIIKGAYYAGMG